MIKKVMIEVGGKEYPCYRTMRAMVDQSREKLDLNTFEGVLKSVYLTIKGACLREQVEFKFEFEQFVDNVTPEVMEIFASLNDADDSKADIPDDGKKK
jgi:hypothetical protein